MWYITHNVNVCKRENKEEAVAYSERKKQSSDVNINMIVSDLEIYPKRMQL